MIDDEKNWKCATYSAANGSAAWAVFEYGGRATSSVCNGSALADETRQALSVRGATRVTSAGSYL